MADKKKFMNRMLKEEGAVDTEAVTLKDPLGNCAQSDSPSVNWAFATKGHGLPFGLSAVLYGPPKGGKSIVCNSFVGVLHRTDPEAMAITFNTELRAKYQQNAEQMKVWGIDPDRFMAFDRNTPEGVFDYIEHDVDAMNQEGANIRMIIIDSMTNLAGRRALNATSVGQQQIGDEAATKKDGLKRILPIIRKWDIALILTAHVRAEMDQKEIMRGKTVKMAEAWATKHTAEFFCYIEPNRSKDGKTNLIGAPLQTEEYKDLMDKAQKTGHKIRFRVEESSLGPSGRTGEFTLDYDRGIVNVSEEIFQLGRNVGIIERPNNQTYVYDGVTWRGMPAMLSAIEENKELAAKILAGVFAKDLKK